MSLLHSEKLLSRFTPLLVEKGYPDTPNLFTQAIFSLNPSLSGSVSSERENKKTLTIYFQAEASYSDVWLTVLGLVVDFTRDFEEELKSPGNPIMSRFVSSVEQSTPRCTALQVSFCRIFGVVLHLLQGAPRTLLSQLYCALQVLI